jgi:hypothetical protein
VQVQVVHLLAAVPVAVDDQAIAIFGDALAPREVARDQQQPAHQQRVVVADVVRRRDRLVRHHEDVHGRAGADVAERGDRLVAVDDVGGQLARDDALEQGRHGTAPWAGRRRGRGTPSRRRRVDAIIAA